MNITNTVLQSIVVAALIALGNGIATTIGVYIAFRRTETPKVLNAIIASMAIRMACMLGAVWYGLKIWKLHVIAFPLALLSLYIVFMVVEITIIHRRELRLQRQRAENASAHNALTFE